MPKTLTKPDLVTAIAESSGITKAKAGLALDALVESITSNVSKGNTVRVPNLGTWKRQNRKARTARNPQTGRPVNVPATKIPKYSASVGFKELVSGNTRPKKKAPARPKTKARRPAARKAPARKAPARKAPARKAPARKAPARKAPARKAPARRR